jgi:hypothetical protein
MKIQKKLNEMIKSFSSEEKITKHSKNLNLNKRWKDRFSDLFFLVTVNTIAENQKTIIIEIRRYWFRWSMVEKGSAFNKEAVR